MRLSDRHRPRDSTSRRRRTSPPADWPKRMGSGSRRVRVMVPPIRSWIETGESSGSGRAGRRLTARGCDGLRRVPRLSPGHHRGVFQQKPRVGRPSVRPGSNGSPNGRTASRGPLPSARFHRVATAPDQHRRRSTAARRHPGEHSHRAARSPVLWSTARNGGRAFPAAEGSCTWSVVPSGGRRSP